MPMPFKRTIVFALCCFLQCNARLFTNFNATNFTSNGSEVAGNGHQNFNATNVSVGTTTKKVAINNCFVYLEYCVNKSVTYKFQTILRGRLSPNKKPDLFNMYQNDHTRCQCDSDCGKYGDCCYDKLQIDNVTGEPLHLPEDSGIRWECRKLPIKIKALPPIKTEVLVIGSCPPDYDDQNIIHQCNRHNVPQSQYHYTMDFPLLSSTTNLTYSNLFCAICNNETQFRKWEVKVYCPPQISNCTQFKEEWNYVQGQNKWTMHFNGTNYTITYDLLIDTNRKTYYSAFNARKCRQEVIRDCPHSWPRDKNRTLCTAYSLLVRSNDDDKLYKNEHCAVCNGQRRTYDNLVCPKPTKSMPGQSSAQDAAKKTHSYSILMDFYGDGSRVGETRNCGSKIISVCQFGEFCDPIQGRCRPYTCGRKYIMNSEGKCILNTTVPSFTDGNSTYSNDSINALPVLSHHCPKLFIHRPHYTDLPNNSIYINATSVTYSATEHEFVNETTVLICTSNNIYNFGKFSKAQSILSMIGISISLICLAVHIFVHSVVPQLRNLHGKNILSLSVALFMAQSFFEFGLNLSHSFPLCVIVAMTVHFGFLASFFWMNIMAIDVCRTFATKSYRPSSDGVWKEYKRYSLYGWFLPFVIVMMAFTNDVWSYVPQLQPLYAQPLCWINSRDALLIFFAGPLALLLLENIVLFLLTVKGIYTMAKISKFARTNSTASGQGIANDRTRIILYAKLALIMGLTWIFSFIAALSNYEVLWYLFIIFNSLQGAFIFAAFSCKKKTLRMVQDRFEHRFGKNRKVLGNKDSSMTQSSKILSMLSTSLQNINRIKESAN